MQKNDSWKIVVSFGYIVVLTAVAVLCILSYSKKPTDEEVSAYIASLGRTEVTGGINTAVDDVTFATTEAATEAVSVNPLLPSGAVSDKSATLSDIAGYYEGTLSYNKITGYEDMQGVPADINERVEAELSATHDASLTIDKDGRWKLDVKSEMNMDLSDDLLTDKEFDGKLKSVDNGYFKVERQMSEGGNAAHILFEGNVYDVSGSRTIAGHAYVEMTNDGVTITMDMEFSTDYVGEEAP